MRFRAHAEGFEKANRHFPVRIHPSSLRLPPPLFLPGRDNKRQQRQHGPIHHTQHPGVEGVAPGAAAKAGRSNQRDQRHQTVSTAEGLQHRCGRSLWCRNPGHNAGQRR